MKLSGTVREAGSALARAGPHLRHWINLHPFDAVTGGGLQTPDLAGGERVCLKRKKGCKKDATPRQDRNGEPDLLQRVEPQHSATVEQDLASAANENKLIEHRVGPDVDHAHRSGN
jgi:hypothetical protein